MAGLLSTVTITTVGFTCKAFLNIGFCSVTTNGLPILLHALERGQGVITVGNHISTLDDPVTWGILPANYYLNSRKTRWALGASDIMFTNPVLSAFFRQGQTLETFRGKGIYQPAVDTAIKKLNQGGWVHLFSEGKVNQPHHYPQINGVGHLPRFKWGIGRILMETAVVPIVIPMWLTGFDKMMPEGRPFPYNFIPRLGTRLSITFGDPLPSANIKAALGMILSNPNGTSLPSSTIETQRRGGINESAWIDAEAKHKLNGTWKQSSQAIDEDMRFIRSKVTAIVQRAVEALGRKVSGDTLRNS